MQEARPAIVDPVVPPSTRSTSAVGSDGTSGWQTPPKDRWTASRRDRGTRLDQVWSWPKVRGALWALLVTESGIARAFASREPGNAVPPSGS